VEPRDATRAVSAREAVKQFEPTDVDPELLTVVRPVAVSTLLTIVTDDDSTKTAEAWTSLMIRLLVWRRAFGDRIDDPRRFLIPFVVDAFLAQLEVTGDYTQHTLATWRSHLRRIGLLLGIAEWERVKDVRVRTTLPRPYSPDDVDRLLLAARSVPSRVVRPRVEAVTLACLAAGLSTPDLRTVGPDDVWRDPDDGTVLVRVGGDAPRVVVALDRYADDLLAARDRVNTRLLVGNNPARKSLVSQIVQAMRRVDGDDFSVQRLRSTWIVGHLEAGVPLPYLTIAAGLRKPEALLRYAAFAQPIYANPRNLFRGQTS
jgi:integrase